MNDLAGLAALITSIGGLVGVAITVSRQRGTRATADDAAGRVEELEHLVATLSKEVRRCHENAARDREKMRLTIAHLEERLNVQESGS